MNGGEANGREATRQEVLERLRGARGFIFDMDGTLALGDRVNHGLRPLPGAADMLAWVRGRGLPSVVFTNGTNRSPGISRRCCARPALTSRTRR